MPLWPWLIFTTIYGACAGSFLNVVIYRLPEGKSLIHPPSACPKCNTRLAWYDNVPILGWLWLRGRCRYCRNPISVQYPIIEAITAALFGGLFWVYYMSGWKPVWGDWGPANTWPVFIVVLTLVGSLVATTLVDARLYIIPLSIPWCVTLVAAIVLPMTAWLLPESRPVIQVIEGPWLGGALGGTIGLIIAIVLLELGVLPLSFAEEMEGELPHDQLPHTQGSVVPDPSSSMAHTAEQPPGTTVEHLNEPAEVQLSAMQPETTDTLSPTTADSATPVATEPTPTATTEEPVTDHPHLSREILKEVAFVALPLTGFIIGMVVWQRMMPHPWNQPELAAAWPALGGVAMGYLVGGALIWFTRIIGSLAFQKEAMGLGDVHLLAGIGAVLGWRAAVMVFFIAPFLGLAYTAASVGMNRLLQGHSRVIPYGPYLAAATLIVMAKEWPWLTGF